MAQTIINAPVSVSFSTMPCEYRLITAQCADAGLAQFERRHRPISQSVSLDPWEIRDDFLGISEVSELQDFLNRTGVFDIVLPGFADLVVWQGLVAKLLGTNPQRWRQLANEYGTRRVQMVLRASKFGMRFRWDQGRPSCAILVGTTLAALVATAHVDHLRGARFRFCARPDCGKPYEVESKHKRLYCSQYCAHFTSLRRLREKKRRAEREQTAETRS